MISPPPISTLFPYTTLFRSHSLVFYDCHRSRLHQLREAEGSIGAGNTEDGEAGDHGNWDNCGLPRARGDTNDGRNNRSLGGALHNALRVSLLALHLRYTARAGRRVLHARHSECRNATIYGPFSEIGAPVNCDLRRQGRAVAATGDKSDRSGIVRRKLRIFWRRNLERATV